MSQYYYLIAGLPDLSLDDGKLSYTVAQFKEEIYPDLSDADKKLIDIFYLKFDNQNVLKLLQNKEATIDERGNFTADQLNECIAAIQEGEKPTLKGFPAYLSTFISQYLTESIDSTLFPEDHLATLYYTHAMKSNNRFLAAWFEFNLNINNLLVAFTSRKFKWEYSHLIVGHSEVSEALRTSRERDFGLSGEVDYFDSLQKINDLSDLVERERKTDALRWAWLEDGIFFHYFTIERIFAFLLRTEMIERWIGLDKEKGRESFRELIDSLKDEVKIPEEFRI